MAYVFTLIGDLVGSRRVASRAAVQDALAVALVDAARLVPPVDRLEATVGDEYQGVFSSLGDATLAALLVRLNLGGTVDTRCGIGLGEREVFRADRTPMLQDGPAWWSARAAIDALGVPANRLRRTWFDAGDVAATAPAAGLVNAYLATRDALVDRMNARARSVLLLAVAGRTQREIAQAEGVSESAVSQVMARGVGAVRDAQAMLTELDAGNGRPAS
ncbi:MAG TPA: SatD family protein [Jatrophihabitans sp.]|jgi:DNA-binding CsgD family transcriptional regulator|uniref:SatD family protein n=1 Tax=Jatrophihabitans sp. TaxID=1932789 RepID=UPI002DF7B022|nr:SatD family protein [Jatrophihabitans sp.]